MLEPPDPEALLGVNDVTIEDFPDFAPVTVHRDPPVVEDVDEAVADALADIPALEDLPAGAEVGLTGGSRGIRDMPAVLAAAVEELEDRGLEPFVFAAMGSHGGATAEGQRETLASVGITEAAVGCEIRSDMAVETVAEDGDGRPVYAAEDALDADAVLIANRIKLHTDFAGDIESGLCKMAVVGLGKQRGADAAHNAALATSFREVLPERAELLFEATPVVGGLGVIENAEERAAEVHGLPVDEIVDREPDLLDRSAELFPELPVEELDLLILDEIGKDISGTGMDTNVIGRMLIHGEPEPGSPEITRVYARSLTEETHGNANGIGLADFAHVDAVEEVDLTTTYINNVSGGQPERGRIPLACPSDRVALHLAYSTTGVADPGEMRIARIENTLEPDDLQVSAPIARELADCEGVTVGAPEPLSMDGDELAPPPY